MADIKRPLPMATLNGYWAGLIGGSEYLDPNPIEVRDVKCHPLRWIC